MSCPVTVRPSASVKVTPCPDAIFSRSSASSFSYRALSVSAASSVFTLTELTTWMAELAKRSVLRLSSLFHLAGEMQATMAVRALPPREEVSRRVSLELR